MKLFQYANVGQLQSQLHSLGTSYFFLKPIEAELMQYLRPVSVGPSSKTCPRWDLHYNIVRLLNSRQITLAHWTSVRIMPWDVSFSSWTLSFSHASKEGQPQPESNLVLDLKELDFQEKRLKFTQKACLRRRYKCTLLSLYAYYIRRWKEVRFLFLGWLCIG